MKTLLFFLLTLISLRLNAQENNCLFKQPLLTIHFGRGNVDDLNTDVPYSYRRVTHSCPIDGQYAYASFTSECFRGDWLTLTEDHTPGDVDGNMMLVNASWDSGPFLTTTVRGLKAATIYEFGAWLMNVCKPSRKCPFPLLPDITVQLQTPEGKSIARFNTGELVRRDAPQWMQYRGLFTTPPAATTLTLIMTDNAPGGCGNDFALDDITFRECIKPPVVTTVPKVPVAAKRQPAASKPVAKKEPPPPVKRATTVVQVEKPQTGLPMPATPVAGQRPLLLPPPPVLATRENPLVQRLETEAGDIRLDLYDNGEIDGDTVSIYHNNVLVADHAGLSQKPITLRIAVSAAHPHHELIMVADNLGAIPPNTSLMIVTTATRRYEVFISSTEQKNAKLVIDLKK